MFIQTILARCAQSLSRLRAEWQWSYLPSMMVYFATGIQGFSGIAGTFFVKEHLDLSAEFLAALAFWSALPFVIKMPIGHLVDLLWRYRNWLVYLGGLLMALGYMIFAGLIGQLALMNAYASTQAWFVLATLLLPMGFVLQDAVADAMTVEAVPRRNADGLPLSAAELHARHTIMQTLGRIAVMSGALAVALLNVGVFSDVTLLTQAQKSQLYLQIYLASLAIPLISVSGIWLWQWMKMQPWFEGSAVLGETGQQTKPNLTLLLGSFVFIVLSMGAGLFSIPYGQELVFVCSLGILIFLITRLTADLTLEAKQTLWATAAVIFVFRATPSVGEGLTWWAIDVLGYDQHFLSILSLLSYALTLQGLFALRSWVANQSVATTIVWLSVVHTVIALPNIAMSMGFHEWTAQHTGGVVDARFIGLTNTALESPLAQIAMIPMLAWIASTAPAHLKATYFAVIASFTNLALSAAQLGTKYLNQSYTLMREMRDQLTKEVTVAANYSDLTVMLLWVAGLGLLMPLVTVGFVRFFRFKVA